MIIPVLLLAFIIRLISLNQSLWLDEAINVVYAQNSNLYDYLTRYLIGDFHPPGWFAILWIWGHLWGFSEISVRLPSLIFGVLTIYIVYKLGSELFSKKVGLLASLLLTLAPLHIYYSQESRPYSFAAFAVVLSYYFFIKLLNKSRYGVIFYAFSIALVLYSDYVAYFVLISQVFYVIIFERKALQRFFLAFGLGVLIFSPWLVIFPKQLVSGLTTASGLEGWKSVVGGSSLKNLGLLWVKLLIGRISFENRITYGLIVSITSVLYLIPLIVAFKRLDKRSLIIFWVIIPPVLVFITSFFVPVFNYFRFIFLLPGFYLLVAYGISKFSHRIVKVIFALLISAQILFSASYLLIPKFQREDWKSAVFFVRKQMNNNSIVLFENNEIPAPFEYYGSDIPAFSGLKKIPAKSTDDVVNLMELIGTSNRVYLFEYLFEITDNQELLEKELINSGFKEINKSDFRGVGFVKEFYKNR